MENKRILYDFCPACSGLMKNGVCIACGYEKDRTQEDGLPAGNVKRPEAAMAGGGAAEKGRTAPSGGGAAEPGRIVSSGGGAAEPDRTVPFGGGAGEPGRTVPSGGAGEPGRIMPSGGAAKPGRTASFGSGPADALQRPAHGKLAGLLVGLGIAAAALILCIALYLIARDVTAASPQSREAAAEEAELEASGSRLPFSSCCCSLPSV